MKGDVAAGYAEIRYMHGKKKMNTRANKLTF